VTAQAYLDIRRNADAVVRRHPRTWEWDDDGEGSPDFMWSEGNFSCDCNRHNFFQQAGGVLNAYECTACSETLYSVRLTSVESGSVLYQDGDEWQT
jgi:hypothetical protein